METTLRTFCVIPHEARDDDFFDAVFEDGVRAVQHGRLHSLFFSHVLSPAHDIAGHVIGPLLSRVRQGGNAVLIVALPEEDHDGYDNVNGGSSETDAASDGVTSGEKLDVALDLYAQLLPLLFQSAERCCFARVSVVSFAVKGKRVYDVLQRCEVRSERQAQYQLIEREGSSTRWGTIMKLLHERHDQLESANVLPKESVLVVRVELEGYGAALLAEVGCGRETLHQLTLLLRSGGACGAKTYPPRGPLSSVLRDVVPPAALVHVVGLPDPAPSPRGTMRLLRFLSGMCSAPATGTAAAAAASESRPTQSDNGKGLMQRSATRHSDTHTELNAAAGARRRLHPCVWGEDLFVDPSHCINTLPGRSHNTSAAVAATTPVWDWGAARAEEPLRGSVTNAQSSGSGAAEDGGAVGAVPHTSREQTLVSRTVALERTNRELVEALSDARNQIQHLQGLQQSSQEALRQKQDALLAATASSQKGREENADYAKLVPKLLRKVKELEKERDALQQSLKDRENQTSDLQQTNHRLQEQLQRLQREVKVLEKRETQRLREHALNRIGSGEEEKRPLRSRANKPTSPRRRRSGTTSPMTDTGKHLRAGGAPSTEGGSTLLNAIAELRQRNTSLEAEVQELRQRRPAVDPVPGRGTVDEAAGGEHASQCPMCETMRHHLRQVSEELDRSCMERERLQSLLADRTVASSHAPAIARDAVSVVATSLTAGCESMRVQLEHLGAEATRRHVQQSLRDGVFREHVDAVAVLEAAVHDIGGRRYRGVEDYERIVPSRATAAEAELLSSLLLFEVERCSRLRAFLPTFAQLGVATEHLKMRVLPAEC
ncbi:hypothetical protein DQ04_01301100 [Trypanosoma grayi]|uniref:hypothetical protein n=1 Tax=Trypanosoma grayi TaxID=71804 RepID=UPI0004F3F357|nr:hypothetical protein DQ04_01301100 [Trypanosoma grayi]KEG12966.1 hypothetical protein DQ04_01301100 [Trypanosoma grayi]